MQTGVISGGKALNIVPADCRFDFEIRALPSQDPALVAEALKAYAEREVLPRMRAVSAQSDIRFSALSAYPGLATDAQSQAAELISAFCGSTDFGTVAFGTEGGLFDAVGIPTVVCGPGSMDQGHKPDEFVSLDQLQACDQMLQRMLAFISD
ncbi:Acetylornithine deacetylase [compost metagenome]